MEHARQLELQVEAMASEIKWLEYALARAQAIGGQNEIGAFYSSQPILTGTLAPTNAPPMVSYGGAHSTHGNGSLGMGDGPMQGLHAVSYVDWGASYENGQPPLPPPALSEIDQAHDGSCPQQQYNPVSIPH